MATLADHDSLTGETPPDYPILFTGGACLDDNGTLFVRAVIRKLNDNDVRHCVVLKYDESGWHSFLIQDGITAQSASEADGWTLYSLGSNGTVHVSTGQSEDQEVIDGSRLGPSDLRWMYDLKRIGGDLWAVGMARMVYRRDESGTWIQAGQGAEVNDPQDIDCGFRSVSGFSEDHLIAVGMKGEIWQCRSGVWQQMDSPTNLTLNAVLCSGDGSAYACGAAGVVLRLSNGDWDTLGNGETDEQLWSIARFGDSIYVADSDSIFRIVADRLEKVDLGITATASYLYSAPEVLWSVGATHICRFDGRTWERIPPPKFPARR